jgi:hypothetical protein
MDAMRNQSVTDDSELGPRHIEKVPSRNKDLELAVRLRDMLGQESVTAFGRRCGIGEATLRKYFSGTLPNSENLVAMADAGNVSIEWLAAGRGPKARGAILNTFKVGLTATPTDPHQQGMIVLDEAHSARSELGVAEDLYRSPGISKFLMRVTMASSRATWLPTNMDDEDRMAIANTAVQMLIPVIKDSHAILLGIMNRPTTIDLSLRLAFDLHTHVIPK